MTARIPLQLLAVVLLSALLLPAGCLTLDANVTVNPARGGGIDGSLWMTEAVYSTISVAIGEDFFTYVTDAYQQPGIPGPLFTKRVEGGMVYIDFAAAVARFPEQGNLTVTVSNDILRYEDRTFSGDANQSGDLSLININYRLTLPNPVQDSNAHSVQGNVAEWHFRSQQPGVLYATCTAPAQAPAPGLVAGLAGVMLAVALALRRRG